GSLLLALTYVPAVATLVVAKGRESHAGWFDRLRVWYAGRLAWSLEHKRVVVSVAVVVMVAALGSLPFIGTEFMPKLDEGSLLIETRRPPSTALREGVGISEDVERTLLKFPEVRSVVTNLGRPETATEVMGLFQADVYVLFNPKSAWKAKSLDALIEIVRAHV